MTSQLTQTEYEMAVRQVLRSGKVCYYGPCYRRWVQTLLLASLFLLVWSGGCVAWLSTGVSIRYGAVVCFLIATTVLIFGMLVFTLVRKQVRRTSLSSQTSHNIVLFRSCDYVLEAFVC